MSIIELGPQDQVLWRKKVLRRTHIINNPDLPTGVERPRNTGEGYDLGTE